MPSRSTSSPDVEQPRGHCKAKMRDVPVSRDLNPFGTERDLTPLGIDAVHVNPPKPRLAPVFPYLHLGTLTV